MVEGDMQQVNDEDELDKVVLDALSAKVSGQLESMVAMMHEDGYSVQEAIESVTLRFDKFLTEFRYQAAVQLTTGGIPQMPEVREEGR